MTTKTQQLRDTIEAFISQQFLFDFDGEQVKPTTNLFTAGLVDSFGFVELITFLETEFSIKFTDEELLGTRLNSLKGITAVVKEKVNAR